MSRLMGTFDILLYIRPEPFVQVFMVAFYSYLLHQIIQKDFDVLRGDAGILHWSITAHLAVLTETPHFDSALPGYQLHVEDHHHPVGRPASSALAAFEP